VVQTRKEFWFDVVKFPILISYINRFMFKVTRFPSEPFTVVY